MIRIHLAKLLEEKEISQRKFRRMTGICPRTVNAYFHEYAKRVNIEDLNKICKVLNCKLHELIEYLPDEE